MTLRYDSAVKPLGFKWLNRRSQRKSFTRAAFKHRWLGGWAIPGPRTVELGSRQRERELPLDGGDGYGRMGERTKRSMGNPCATT